eukprot:2170319-Rhodomonas_salina.1
MTMLVSLLLRAHYAMSSTDLAYDAICRCGRCVLPGTDVAHATPAWNGQEMVPLPDEVVSANARATRCPVLT